jgi:hypothetical protein
MFLEAIAKIIVAYVEPWRPLAWIPVEAVLRAELWANPRGLDFCLAHNLPMSWEWLSRNPHPWALAKLEQNPQKLCTWQRLLNPALTADEIFRQTRNISAWCQLLESLSNPALHEIAMAESNWNDAMTANPHDLLVARGFREGRYNPVHPTPDMYSNGHPRIVEILLKTWDKGGAGSETTLWRHYGGLNATNALCSNPDPAVLAKIGPVVLPQIKQFPPGQCLLPANPSIFEPDHRLLRLLVE